MEVTSQDREKIRNIVFHLIRKVEGFKEKPAPEEKVRSSVTEWEQKLFDAFRQNREEYIKKAQTKEQQLIQECKRKSAQIKQQVPIDKSTNPTTTATTTNSVHSTTTTNHRPTPIPTTTAAVTITTSATTTSISTTSSLSSSKDTIEELREPLEQCRAILRILNVFGVKKDAPLKDEFLDIFRKTTDMIKRHRSSLPNRIDLEQQVAVIDKELKQLRAKLDPRFVEYKKLLNIPSLTEMLELDSTPFGLLERAVEVNGPSKFSARARAASIFLGGRHSLKRARHL